jgi:hypothetical protein
MAQGWSDIESMKKQMPATKMQKEQKPFEKRHKICNKSFNLQPDPATDLLENCEDCERSEASKDEDSHNVFEGHRTTSQI